MASLYLLLLLASSAVSIAAAMAGGAAAAAAGRRGGIEWGSIAADEAAAEGISADDHIQGQQRMAAEEEDAGGFSGTRTKPPSILHEETIPAAPVEGQARSCALDLSEELLGGVRAACMKGGKAVDRRRCCPVLAAWLMAARSRTALHPPLQAAPPLSSSSVASISASLPLLPDDSLVCISSLKSALAERGILLSPPNSSCDVVTCLCNIRLSHLSPQSCPLPFSWRRRANHSKLAASAVDFPLQPSSPAVRSHPSVGSSPAPPPGLSDLLFALASNCTDHSYRGCTRCLRTLRKEVSSNKATNGSSSKALNCELVGLMWLLEVNKTFYIPTVSAVVRALMYSGGGDGRHVSKAPVCSADTENMPLALDYSEILTTTTAVSAHSAAAPPLFRAASPIPIPVALFLLLLPLFFASRHSQPFSTPSNPPQFIAVKP